jgi:hypothetical protein
VVTTVATTYSVPVPGAEIGGLNTNSVLPSGETEITLPTAEAIVDTIPDEVETDMRPLLLPRYTNEPSRLMRIEFGVYGRVMAVPAVFVLVSTGVNDVPEVLAT